MAIAGQHAWPNYQWLANQQPGTRQLINEEFFLTTIQFQRALSWHMLFKHLQTSPCKLLPIHCMSPLTLNILRRHHLVLVFTGQSVHVPVHNWRVRMMFVWTVSWQRDLFVWAQQTKQIVCVNCTNCTAVRQQQPQPSPTQQWCTHGLRQHQLHSKHTVDKEMKCHQRKTRYTCETRHTLCNVIFVVWIYTHGFSCWGLSSENLWSAHILLGK